MRTHVRTRSALSVREAIAKPLPAMNHADLGSGDTPLEQLLKIRHALVDRIWQGLVVIAVLGAPLSASRSIITGWMALYTLHLAVALLVVAVYWFRARIPFAVKSALILLIFWVSAWRAYLNSVCSVPPTGGWY